MGTMCLLSSCCIARHFLRWDTDKVRDRFGGLRMIKVLGTVINVIIDVITVVYYSCNSMQVLFKYKYKVKTCMYTIII